MRYVYDFDEEYFGSQTSISDAYWILRGLIGGGKTTPEERKELTEKIGYTLAGILRILLASKDINRTGQLLALHTEALWGEVEPLVADDEVGSLGLSGADASWLENLLKGID